MRLQEIKVGIRKVAYDEERRKSRMLDAAAEKTEEEPRRKIRGRAARTEGELTERREKTVTVARLGRGGRRVGGVGCGLMGVQGASSQHSQWEQTSGREDGTEPVLMGEKLAAPWMSPSTFHFVNAVLSVTPVNKAPMPRKKRGEKKKRGKHALFAAVHNYQPSRRGACLLL